MTPAIRITGTIAFATLTGLSNPAHGTILLFDQTRDSSTHTQVLPTGSGSSLEPDYGDRVTGAVQPVPGGEFTYGEAGEGFTPNVVVDITAGAGAALWQRDYGDLVNVAFGPRGSNQLQVDLTADAGFEVLLHGVDLGGWPNTDYTITAVRVLDAATAVFSSGPFLVEGHASGSGHSAISFAQALHGQSRRIEIDFSNLPEGQHDNIGIDNIRFGQNPPGIPAVPEPSGGLLLAAGLVAMASLIRRRRGSSQH